MSEPVCEQRIHSDRVGVMMTLQTVLFLPVYCFVFSCWCCGYAQIHLLISSQQHASLWMRPLSACSNQMPPYIKSKHSTLGSSLRSRLTRATLDDVWAWAHKRKWLRSSLAVWTDTLSPSKLPKDWWASGFGVKWRVWERKDVNTGTTLQKYWVVYFYNI